MAQPDIPMLRVIDESPMTWRYWNFAAMIAIGTALEFFDFFMVGFIVSIIGPEWNLTFGQVALILYTGGIGAMVGSLLWGWLGHRLGRRIPFIAAIVTWTVFSGVLALSPEGAVWYLALMRFIVGAGVGGMITISLTAMVEFTPTRRRSDLAGFATVGLIPLGTLLAASTAAAFGPEIGWRGLAALGLVPLPLVAWAYWAVPESPRWLISQGRTAEARRVVARFLNRAEESLSMEVPPPKEEVDGVPPTPQGYRALYSYKRSFWFTVLAWLGATTAIYGLILFGPTLFTLVLEVTPARAAQLFVYVTLGALAGRIVFPFISNWLGRRRTGLIMGIGGGVMLALSVAVQEVTVAGASLFVIAFVLADFFLDGGFTNLAPASSEVFPTRLRTHGAGLAQFVNGIGKIIGPLGLALVIGSSNIVSPQATRDAMVPGLFFLAAFSILAAVGFLLLPETRGRSLEALEDELEEARHRPRSRGAAAPSDVEVGRPPGTSQSASHLPQPKHDRDS